MTYTQRRAIGAWAAEHGVWVLTDEIYDHLVYGDATFTSMPAVVPEVRDRLVHQPRRVEVVPADLEDVVRLVHRHTVPDGATTVHRRTAPMRVP